jgi:uncharacterized protein
MLANVVIDLRSYWLDRVPPGTLCQDGIDMVPGASPAAGSAPVSHTPEPGRNDPCPCGSGKKYKKCCGSPTADDIGGESRH